MGRDVEDLRPKRKREERELVDAAVEVYDSWLGDELRRGEDGEACVILLDLGNAR